MATVSVILRKKYYAKDGYQIAIRIHHKDKTRYFKTGYNVPSEFWEEKRKRVKGNHPLKEKINSVIQDMVAQAERYEVDCKINKRPFDFDKIFPQMEKGQGKDDTDQLTFTGYLQMEVAELEKRGKPTSGRNLAKIITHLIKWKQGPVTFEELLKDGALADLDQYLRETLKHSNNTRALNFASMRQKWNRAASRGLAPSRNPFVAFKFRMQKPKKEKLTHEEIEALWNYKSSRRNRNMVRDMFLFSYYCRGIRFENVITIRKEDISRGQVEFFMVKSHKSAYAEIHPRLQQIIDRWKDSPGPYLFPLLKEEVKDRNTVAWERKKASLNTNVNDALDVIMRTLEIKRDITFHCARHTFAHHFLLKGSPIEFIKEALGHSNIATTHRYLGELDNRALDEYLKRLYTPEQKSPGYLRAV